MRAFIDKALGQIKEFFAKLTKKEKIRLAILVAAIMALSIVAVILLGRTRYVDLYTDLAPDESGQILDVLEQMNVPAKTPDVGTIQVPEDMAVELRMRLAAQGYNSSAPDLSIIQSGGGFSMTDQEYRTLQKYQMQEDIKQQILMSPRIKACKVNLNPQENTPYVFSQNASEARCAVTVELVGEEKLSKNEANALIELIRGSVSGLKAENITISDSNLNLYTINGLVEEETDDTSEDIKYQFDLEDRTRARLEEQVRQFLLPVFGEDGFRVIASVELDFDDIKSKSIEFAPPVPDETEGMIRSMSELSKSMREEQAAEGPPGTDTNGMGATEYPVATSENGELYSEILREYNYEMNELTTEIQRARGTIKSLSIGVVIDKGVYPDDCKDAVQNLVATAVGTKLDYVSVEQLLFTKAADTSEEIERQREASKQRDLIQIGVKYGVLALLGIAIIWLIYSIFRMFAPKPEPQPVLVGAVGGTLDYMIGDEDGEDEDPDDGVLSKYQDVEISAKLTGVEQLEKFIEKDPKAVAQLLRNWLTDDI